MENLLYDLKTDIQMIIKNAKEISELQTRLFYINDLNDKRNYNPERVKGINKLIADKQAIYEFLIKKWGI